MSTVRAMWSGECVSAVFVIPANSLLTKTMSQRHILKMDEVTHIHHFYIK